MKAISLISLVLMFGLAACSSDSTNISDSPSPIPLLPEEEITEIKGASDKEITADYILNLSNYSFEPNTIITQAGATITVQLTNTQGTHDFVIDELDIQSSTLQTGESKLLTITIPEDGAGKELPFYCSIGNHRQMGMEGTLIISE